MADNYLERRMEDYQNGKLATRNRRSGSINQIKSSDISAMRIFVTAGTIGIGEKIVEHIAKHGCKVAFCDTDIKAGRQLSQATSSQFHPMSEIALPHIKKSLDYVAEKWGGVDVVIDTCTPSISGLENLPILEKASVITVKSGGSSSVNLLEHLIEATVL